MIQGLHIWRFGFGKGLQNGHFVQQADAQDLQNCVELRRKPQPLADNGDQQVSGHRDPHLGLHRVFGGAVERLDAQVLLDPLEEQLDLPAASIKIGDGLGRELEVVGQEHQSLVSFGIQVADAPQRRGVALDGVEPPRRHGLIALHSGLFVHRMRSIPAKPEVPLGPE